VEQRTSSEDPLILVVDDDEAIVRMIRLELTTQGFRVATASTGEQAVRICSETLPDCTVLDMIMQDDGMAAIERIKAACGCPILFTTARPSDMVRDRALALGADDFIAKPFNPEDLTQRIRMLLGRHAGGAPEPRLQLGDDVEVDVHRRLVLRHGEPVHLARTEWLLLEQLVKHAGEPVSSEELLEKVFGSEFRYDSDYLGIWISRLRRKLEDDPHVPRVLLDAGGHSYMIPPRAA
jgi:two-component system, OmpR family, KDP operon response regulator KdpE